MTNLRKLIKESKISKKELVALTLRMSKELHSFIEELTEHLSLSKQEVLLMLVEEGATVAKDELKLNIIEEQEKSDFYLLNTNKGNSIEDHENMLRNGIAAAFYGNWKKYINRINEGDVVFLYENGKGIVAYGKGTGNTLKREHNGEKDECYYQELEGFIILETPLSASEIKKILGRNVVFLKTMSALPDGKEILNEIAGKRNVPKN